MVMNKIVYPLQQVMEVKQKRVDDAEKVVKEKQQALEKEKEKLAAREADRDKVKTHQVDKLTQLREELDGGTTSPKIQQMKAYLKVVDEKLKAEEKKVADQKKEVDKAKENLKKAQEELKLRRLELDKLEYHKKEWEKGVHKELQLKEIREHDELGSMIHSSRQRKSN